MGTANFKILTLLFFTVYFLSAINFIKSELQDLTKIPYPWGRPEDASPIIPGNPAESKRIVGGLNPNERILKWPGPIEGLMKDMEYTWKAFNKEIIPIKKNSKDIFGLDKGDVISGVLKPVSIFEMGGDHTIPYKDEWRSRPYQFVGVLEDDDGNVRWFAKKRPRFYSRRRPFYLRIVVPNRAGMIQYLLSKEKAVVVEAMPKDPTDKPKYRLAKAKPDFVLGKTFLNYLKMNILQNPPLGEEDDGMD